MMIDSLIGSRTEVIDSAGSKGAIVLMTRIRLARNLANTPFPGWAKPEQRHQVLEACLPALVQLDQMKQGFSAEMTGLSDLEKLILMERHLISRELSHAKENAGVVISRDQSCAIMINEEDHLRIQVLRGGYHFKKVWSGIDTVDSALESSLDYAFAPELGFLTACPTNVGTGMRASAMMHLPALVISGQMEKVVRAVNQLGIAVRGLFGEGSDASGSIFQISNQTTLGESEDEILKRLAQVLNTVIEQEMNARERILEKDSGKLYDKIGRAFGILQNSHLLTSAEAMNLLSLIRLGVDLKAFPEAMRTTVDRLFIECQPGHIQYHASKTIDGVERDHFRAGYLRAEFEKTARPDFRRVNNEL
ncbi:MAG: protein arginine kinase [Puniceicoccaceae bacterium]|nr:MAG: protein arginine kinase [Puniceicoccaceae bacterium]